MKYAVRIGERAYQVEIVDLEARPVVALVDGQPVEVWPEAELGHQPAGEAGGKAPDGTSNMEGRKGAPAQPAVPVAAAEQKSLRAPLPGVIQAVYVAVGESVSPGQELFVIEAMKMRNIIRSRRSGTVSALHVFPGQTVNHNDLLVEFEEVGNLP